MAEGSAVQAHRVKLFATTQRGEWDDRGTGFLVPTPDGFRINSETQLCSLLLNHTIRSQEYKQQNENILLWTESSGTTLAISFQSSAQTRELLEHICNVQNRDTTAGVDSDGEEVKLPTPSIEALPFIRDQLSSSAHRSSLARYVCANDYLTLLGALYQQSETSNPASLPVFFAIYKALGKCYAVQMCDPPVMDLLLSEKYYLTFFGALESRGYADDPDLLSCRLNLQKFLRVELTFHNILKITDPALLSKIHKAYRVLFLRDTALARCLDDSTANFLTSLLMYTYTEIISQFVTSTELRVRMVKLLEEGSFEGFACLNELCRMGKSIQVNTRVLFYQALCEDNCFDLLSKALNCPNFSPAEVKQIEAFVPEIILGIMQLAPQFVKRYVVSEEQQRQNFEFLGKVCKCVLNSQEVSAMQGMSDLLKAFLEPDETDQVFLEICEVFYDQIIEKMSERLEVSKVEAEELRICLVEVLNILTQCANQHKSRIANFLDQSEVLAKAIKLLEMQDKCLTLAVLKFLRAVIARNDPALCKHIIDHDLLRPALQVFIANGLKENMIFSSMLALLDAVFRHKPKLIIDYFVRTMQILRLADDLQNAEVRKFFEPLTQLRVEEEAKEQVSCFSTGDDGESPSSKRPGDDIAPEPTKHPKSSNL